MEKGAGIVALLRRGVVTRFLLLMFLAFFRNHFDGGLLIGDAGSFVDPMTGEGITQGMESALIASRMVLDALEKGRFDAAFLSRFDRDFRSYFDPTMLYLTFCAVLMRNWPPSGIASLALRSRTKRSRYPRHRA